jgi:hypothetical protein
MQAIELQKVPPADALPAVELLWVEQAVAQKRCIGFLRSQSHEPISSVSGRNGPIRWLLYISFRGIFLALERRQKIDPNFDFFEGQHLEQMRDELIVADKRRAFTFGEGLECLGIESFDQVFSV